MKELIGVCEALGCTGVESYLQSGNIILNSSLDAPALEAMLERAIGTAFGYADVDVVARTASEILTLMNDLPSAWTGADTANLYFTFLKTPSHAKVEGAGFHPDAYSIGEKVVYVHCPGGYGKTKLNNSYFERVLKVRATTRNWNTTARLCELARDQGQDR